MVARFVTGRRLDVGILDWEGRHSDTLPAPYPLSARPFPYTRRIRPETDDADRDGQLVDCVDAVVERVGLGKSLAVVTASQAPAVCRPANAAEYGRSAGSLHPALRGGKPGIIVSHACASGGLAIAIGASLIAESVVERALILAAMRPRFIERAAFSSSGALSPAPVCRPFDTAADGTALGGFVGAMMLGAHLPGMPYVAGLGIRTLGSGAQSDKASQITCMRAAITAARMPPTMVAAHATGTRHGDRVELEAISELSEKIGVVLPVTSCKGSLGHAVHAAGLATAMFALEAMAASFLPGTAHCTDPLVVDSARVLVSDESLSGRFDAALVNAFGFGGTSCSLMLASGDR